MLPAGTYTFKLADLKGDRHVVQVFNAEQAHGVYDAHNKTWTITVAIKHGSDYTEQLRVTWPPDRAKEAVAKQAV